MSESEQDKLAELLAGMSDEELAALGSDLGIQINPSRPLAGLSDRELRERAAAKGIEIEVSDDPISKEEALRAAKLVPASSLEPPSPPESPDQGGQSRGSAPERPALIRASDLIDPEDHDQGDFEPGGRYKGFEIIDREHWPPEADVMPDASKGIVGHANQKQRFYVRSMSGKTGLVPWPGSQIVWPWEAAWKQDLYRAEVQSFLKEEPEKKKRK